MKKANQPTKAIRAGNIRAVVWTNQSDGGGEYFAVTVMKSYKDADDTWQETTIFGRDDLPKVELVTRKAYEFIFLSAGKSKGDKFTDRLAEEGAEIAV